MTQTTFYTAASAGSGEVGRDNNQTPLESITTIRAGAGTYTAYSVFFGYLCRNVNQFQVLSRMIFQIDTSALTSEATITAATFSAYLNGKAVQNGGSVRLVDSSAASTTAIANSDYANVGSTAMSDTDYDTSTIPTGQYNDFVLNAAGLAAISKTGYTKLGMKTLWDINNNYPATGVANSDYLSWDMTTNKPKLVITYTVPDLAREQSYSFFM